MTGRRRALTVNETSFTVVIPTRERADVLEACIRTVVAQDYPDLRILVSDNCSRDHTADVVHSFNDPRIRYLNPGRRLAMSQHWEFALSHVDGGWLTIVGDDDGLLPGALQRVDQIRREYGVAAVIAHNAAYQWPSANDGRFGRLSVSRRRGCELRASKEWLGKALVGEVAYSALPMLYTGGFADTRLVREGRDAQGVFYRSMVPDVYSAVVFARLTDHYAYSHEPLAVGGTSRHSTGTAHFSNGQPQQPAANPAAVFFGERNIPFHPDLAVPEDGSPPQSIELLVYESFLQSAHLAAPGEAAPDPSLQLQVALGYAKRRHRDNVEKWAEGFARQHGLDLAGAKAAARRIRAREKVRKSLRGLARRMRSIDIAGSDRLPIRDVYDAAIVAATLATQGCGHRRRPA